MHVVGKEMWEKSQWCGWVENGRKEEMKIGIITEH